MPSLNRFKSPSRIVYYATSEKIGSSHIMPRQMVLYDTGILIPDVVGGNIWNPVPRAVVD